LKSKEPRQHENKVNVACLAWAFYPKDIILDMPRGDLVYEMKAPLVTSEGVYGTMKVVGVDPGTEVTCKAVHNGTKAADSLILPGKVPWLKSSGISGDASAKILPCPLRTLWERVNTLFMAVGGLRFLLAKSIAFNTILSIKLLLF
ncbi:TRDC protein, partial [Centropus bengalensis]|nr:TRDC protein [Centropus bengalensis]